MTTDRSTTGRATKRRTVFAVATLVVIGTVVVAALTVFTNDPIGRAAASHRPDAAHRPNDAHWPDAAHQPDPHSRATSAAATGETPTPIPLSQLTPAPTTVPAAPATVFPQGLDQGDPFLLDAGGTFYLYTSQSSLTGANVPVVSGTSVGNWSPVSDALPSLPSWVLPGFTWAPDVHRFGSGYVLYFTAAVAGTNPSMQCIGDAAGTSPTGPFVAQPTPFICQSGIGGSIDPRVFTDADGSNWMVWKSDQNIDGSNDPTQIWTSRLSPDGLGLVGTPTVILTPDEPWQGTIVEAPDLVLVGGHYWLFYSANWFDQPAYGIGAASCAGPQGPCQDLGNQPLVSTNQQGEGPGEESVFLGHNGVWLLYNPWRSYAPSQLTPPRPVAIARVGFGPFGPYIGQTDGTPGGLTL